MRKEFISVFKITKMTMFEVGYYTLRGNKNPYFKTNAMELSRNKRGYSRCGQCQDSLLVKGLAKKFYEKWDSKHLKDLSNNEYEELMSDIEEMKSTYEHIYKEEDTFRDKRSNISFYDIRELSMSK